MTQSVDELFRVNYFTFVVGQALWSLNSRFEQFQVYGDTFGFLFDLMKLQSIDDDSLNTYCANLEDFLIHDSYDVDGNALFSKLKVLRTILPKRN